MYRRLYRLAAPHAATNRMRVLASAPSRCRQYPAAVLWASTGHEPPMQSRSQRETREVRRDQATRSTSPPTSHPAGTLSLPPPHPPRPRPPTEPQQLASTDEARVHRSHDLSLDEHSSSTPTTGTAR